jgi:TldD protein
MFVKEQKHYADSYGTSTTQQRVRIQTQIEAISIGDHGFESMRTLAQPAGFGWEWMGNSHWKWDDEIAELPSLLAEKVAAPSVEPGRYDVLVHPSNLWLTIHESIGHATELDRAIGYEANYAGTSFATPDKLNTLQYGSKLMNVTGDRATPHGLSTVGFDDEGVAAQRWDIIKDGVLVGYQLDRRIAARVNRDRSNGCAFADSPESSLRVINPGLLICSAITSNLLVNSSTVLRTAKSLVNSKMLPIKQQQLISGDQ